MCGYIVINVSPVELNTIESYQLKDLILNYYELKHFSSSQSVMLFLFHINFFYSVRAPSFTFGIKIHAQMALFDNGRFMDRYLFSLFCYCKKNTIISKRFYNYVSYCGLVTGGQQIECSQRKLPCRTPAFNSFSSRTFSS